VAKLNCGPITVSINTFKAPNRLTGK